MNKPLIALTFPGHLSHAQRENVEALLAPLAERLGAEPMVLESGATVAVHHDMAPLIAAIEANTMAVDALVRCMGGAMAAVRVGAGSGLPQHGDGAPQPA